MGYTKLPDPHSFCCPKQVFKYNLLYIYIIRKKTTFENVNTISFPYFINRSPNKKKSATMNLLCNRNDQIIGKGLYRNFIGGIKELSRPGFSKTLVLV